MRGRWSDGLLASALAAAAFGWGALWPNPRPPDALAVVLIVACCAPLIFRRRRPIPALAAHVAVVLVYHALDYPHDAVIPAILVALFTVAAAGPRRHSLPASAATWTVTLAARTVVDGGLTLDVLGTLGWLVAAAGTGEAVRMSRAYVAELVDRAERAERGRTEEVLRQIAEERLRIARDLHDLLAHTITVAQVHAGVGAHLISTGQADPATLATTFGTITDACDRARTELRAALDVLRGGGESDDRRPAPGLTGLPALAEPARAAGIAVSFRTQGEPVALPPAVEVAVFRLVQEALTNVVKHSGAREAMVRLDYGEDVVTVTITDDGRGTTTAAASGHGFVGMRERVRSVSGTLHTESAPGSGFTVTAALPLVAGGHT